MATLTIHRSFAVDAPPEQVMSYLTTPALLVHCLPGAELTSSSEDGATHEGTVTVKLGAISVSYRGTATFEAVDREARAVRVRAKAREKAGAGSAELAVAMQVADRTSGGSEVTLEASASVSGRIVTLGRGMIEIVSEQVLNDFVTCLRSMLAASATTDGAAPPSEPPTTPPPGAAPANALGIFWRAVVAWLRRRLGRA